MKFLRFTEKKISTHTHRHSERGNILFMLLLAVTLFGALGFTVANMIRQETPAAITKERSSLLAGELLDLGRSVRQVVQDLRISSDCSANDMSF